jgi:hypothetical protein
MVREFSRTKASSTYLDGTNNLDKVAGIYEDDANFTVGIFEGELGPSLRHSPGRYVRPTVELGRCPRRASVFVTGCAGIRNFIRIGHGRRSKPKSVAADVNIRNCLLNLRHVARNAFITTASGFVMRMVFYCPCARAVRGLWSVAFKAHHVSRLQQECVVTGAMRIMATRAFDSSRVHDALNKIIPLHTVFMRSAIGEVGKRRLPKLVLLQPPKILQLEACMKADRPIVVLSLDWIRQWAALRMALDANVVRLNEI